MAKLSYKIKENLPAYNSNFMVSLARRLWETKEYFQWARRPWMEVVRDCDDAYLCYRKLPYNEGMQWTDRSDFGTTDVHDGVNGLATRLSLALMDKGNTWLTVVGKKNDDPAVISDIQAQQIWTHERAQTRRQIAKHLKQLMVRGTSAIYWRWVHRTKQIKISDMEGRSQLKKMLRAGKIAESELKNIDFLYREVPEYVGPEIRVLDAFDLYLDPSADLSCDRRTATIVATYRRLEELKRETDMDGELLYSNLDGLMTMTPTEIYMKDVEGAYRLRDLNTQGSFPQNQPYRNEGLVPVYICYMPHFEHEGEHFWDTYFHIAEERMGTQRVIRIEQNPSAESHQFIIKDTMIDWFTGSAYGIGIVEKLLSSYNKKQVLEAVHLEAALTSIFPAYNVLAGVVRDSSGLSFSPGDMNEVPQNALGLKFIEPMPAPANGIQLGIKELQWWGEVIQQGFGEFGLGAMDSTRQSNSSRETATSANIKATSGSLAIDELVEKFSPSLFELAQGVYNVSQRELLPDENDQISYTKVTGPNSASSAGIDWDQFRQPRDIMVNGNKGQFNKAQKLQYLTEFLKGLAQAANIIPNAGMMAQPVVIETANQMDIEIPEEAKLSPQQLAAKDPKVQQMVLQEIIGKDPRIVPVLQQAGIMPPAPKGQAPAPGGGAQALAPNQRPMAAAG